MGIFSLFTSADELAEKSPDFDIYEGEEIDYQIMSADERNDEVVITGDWNDRAAHCRYDDDGRQIEQGPNRNDDDDDNLPWWRR